MAADSILAPRRRHTPVAPAVAPSGILALRATHAGRGRERRETMRPITAADVMNPEVLTVPDDLPVAALASFLVEREISGAPVADAAGHLVGVVSVTDIALAASG